MSSLCSGVLVATHENIRHLLKRLPRDGAPMQRLLDVGCWDGTGTCRYAEAVGCAACGIEVFDEPADQARMRGIDVAQLDLEGDAFPWDAESMDVVIANQVFEHLKNIWLPMAEVFRVLRPGGYFVISVPNLASLHNRILLALGRQPTSIRTFGPHVRGYTFREIKRFVELEGKFVTIHHVGVGFYPLPASVSAPFSRLWPSASHTTLLVARKEHSGPRNPWSDYIRHELESGLQTFYTS